MEDRKRGAGVQVQILGSQKSNDTKKAIRFFSERRIEYHFRDLREKGFSKGELENLKGAVPPDELIDPESKSYKDRGMTYMEYDAIEELMEDPLLAKLPVVRFGRLATAGYVPETWKKWIETDSG
jgi:arsenate reductase-like glutaredoxin family protein